MLLEVVFRPLSGPQQAKIVGTVAQTGRPDLKILTRTGAAARAVTKTILKFRNPLMK